MKVVNVYNYGGPVAAKSFGVKVVMRGHSVLGNPFVMKSERERAKVIAEYRVWLWEQIKSGNEQVLKALRDLKEADLVGCCCAPKACHADVVVRAARWLRGSEAAGAGKV